MRVLVTSIVFILLFACDQRQEQEDDGCWITLYNTQNFQGDKLTFHDQVDLPSLVFKRKGWRGDVKSALVGPEAEVLLYRSENFKDYSQTLPPGSGVAGRKNLSFSQIGSLKIKCIEK